MRYPGGKGRNYQLVINLMPPHTTYIESHLGGGAVMLRKRPAARSIGIDADAVALRRFASRAKREVELVHGDAADYLSTLNMSGNELVYCDPPFWPAARRRPRCYRHDYQERDHHRLLSVLEALPCRVLLSGYRNPLYDDRLRGWRRVDHMAPTHVGCVPESVWANFGETHHLHDYSYIGADFREREALRRRRQTTVRRLADASALERGATLADLADAFPEDYLAVAARLG